MKLFRGKRIDSGEWVEGSLISFDGGTSAIATSKSKIFFPAGKGIATIDGIWEVDPATVGQYIGREIKTGKVFRDDICKSIDGTFLVRWDDDRCAFMISFYEYPNETMHIEEMWEDSEVIGNIHDNPELLEV